MASGSERHLGAAVHAPGDFPLRRDECSDWPRLLTNQRRPCYRPHALSAPMGRVVGAGIHDDVCNRVGGRCEPCAGAANVVDAVREHSLRPAPSALCQHDDVGRARCRVLFPLLFHLQASLRTVARARASQGAELADVDAPAVSGTRLLPPLRLLRDVVRLRRRLEPRRARARHAGGATWRG